MSTVADRLKAANITLPSPAKPVANYVPVSVVGSTVFVSGQIPIGAAGVEHVGIVGDGIDVATAARAARMCGLNLIGQLAGHGLDLDRIRVVKLTGFVAATADFADHPKVVNGASDLMVEVFGDKGRHARSAVGVASLPFGVAVEVEGIFTVDG